MDDVLITDLPDINDLGTKRWFVGDLYQTKEKIFVFERGQRQDKDSPRFMVRSFNEEGEMLSELFFKKRFNMHRYISRLFRVRGVQLTETEDSVQEEVTA